MVPHVESALFKLKPYQTWEAHHFHQEVVMNWMKNWKLCKRENNDEAYLSVCFLSMTFSKSRLALLQILCSTVGCLSLTPVLTQNFPIKSLFQIKMPLYSIGWLSKCWFLDWVLIPHFHWGPLHKYLVGLPYLHFSKI